MKAGGRLPAVPERPTEEEVNVGDTTPVTILLIGATGAFVQKLLKMVRKLGIEAYTIAAGLTTIDPHAQAGVPTYLAEAQRK